MAIDTQDMSSSLERADALAHSDPATAEELYRSVLGRKAGGYPRRSKVQAARPCRRLMQP